MPVNGSGTYSPVHTWVDDEANGIDIEADRMDEQDADIADGLTNCITKDGQTTPTANLPMGGVKITGLGDATADTDALNRQTADGRYIVAAGAAADVVMGGFKITNLGDAAAATDAMNRQSSD